MHVFSSPPYLAISLPIDKIQTLKIDKGFLHVISERFMKDLILVMLDKRFYKVSFFEEVL